MVFSFLSNSALQTARAPRRVPAGFSARPYCSPYVAHKMSQSGQEKIGRTNTGESGDGTDFAANIGRWGALRMWSRRTICEMQSARLHVRKLRVIGREFKTSPNEPPSQPTRMSTNLSPAEPTKKVDVQHNSPWSAPHIPHF